MNELAAPTDVSSRPRLLRGDWAGAVLAVVLGIGSMTAVTAAVVLLDPSQRDHVRETIVLLVGLGLGGHTSVYGLGGIVLSQPLGLTLIGFGILGTVFVRRLRVDGPPSPVAIALQAVRVAAIYLVVLAGLAVGSQSLQYEQARISIGSTLLFGLLWLAVTLVLATAGAFPGSFAGPGSRAAYSVAAILRGLWWIFLLCMVATLAWTAVRYHPDGALPRSAWTVARMLTVTALTFLPNLTLALLLATLGIPVELHGGGLQIGKAVGPDLYSPLWTLADARPAYWLMPVAVGLFLLAGAAYAARYARRGGAGHGGLSLGLALPLVLLLAARFLPIGGTVAAPVMNAVVSQTEFHLLYTVLAGLGWGLALGVLADWLTPAPLSTARPVLATGLRTFLLLFGLGCVTLLLVVTKP